jgi:hypothetical protein
MSAIEEVESLLVDSGLRKKAVEVLLEEFAAMQRRFREKEYAEVGVHMGRFCEAMIKILRVEAGFELKARPSVSNFAHELRDDGGGNVPEGVQYGISDMLLTAYRIRNERDTVHIDLENPVRRSDARTGVTVCSWMLVELIRGYAIDGDTEDIEEIGQLIDRITESTEENPLERLRQSRYEFDERRVADALEGLINIDEDETVAPGQCLTQIDIKAQITAVLLGQLAAYKHGADNAGKGKKWISENTDVSELLVSSKIKDMQYVFEDDSEGGYYIPGFRVDEAVSLIESQSYDVE